MRYAGNKEINFRVATFADIIVSKEKNKAGILPTSIIISTMHFRGKDLLNVDTINLQKTVAVNLMAFLQSACPRFDGREFFNTTYSQLEVN